MNINELYSRVNTICVERRGTPLGKSEFLVEIGTRIIQGKLKLEGDEITLPNDYYTPLMGKDIECK